MSAVVSRILGWSPPDNEDFVDIPEDDALLPLQNPTFHISEPNLVRRLRRTKTGIFQHASPVSSASEHSSDESPTDKRADSNGKHNDPAWVARPRNEFILFRCDYVRKHSREGKRVRRAPGAEAEKTLSKQAAEAWHHLPPEERLYWKERANGERNEHARRYPDYRYRPKKSATGRRRQTRCSPSKPAAPSIEKVNTSAIAQSASEAQSSKHALLLISRQVSSSSKGTPRRYASVPELNVSEPVHRRLRSTASAGWIGSSSREFTPMPRLADNASFEPSDYISPEYAPSNAPQPMGSILQSTNSLLNWNGARMVSAPLQATQFLSSTSVSVSPLPQLGEISSTHMLSEYTTGGNPDPGASELNMFNLAPAQYSATQSDIWMSQLQYLGDHDANRVPSGAVPDSMDAHASVQQPDPSSTSGMYDSSGGPTDVPQDMSNYGLPPDNDSIPVDLLGGESEPNPESGIFAMDTDNFLYPNY